MRCDAKRDQRCVPGERSSLGRYEAEQRDQRFECQHAPRGDRGEHEKTRRLDKRWRARDSAASGSGWKARHYGEVHVRRMVLAALIFVSSAIFARAQSSIQVWPEISAFTKLNDRMRLYFLATTVKESRESTEGEFGPNFDFYLRPLRHPTPFGVFRLDESKNRLLLLRVGYRYLHSFSGDPDEHRGVLEATARYPLVVGVLVSNRNRIDLRFIDGEDSWRYRNRLSVEKEFSIGRVRMNPYARFELYYDSRFDKFSRVEWMGGSAFPLNRRVELEDYFVYQNDSSGAQNRQVYALGAVLNLYF